MAKHERLVAALAEADSGNYMPLLGIAFAARDAQDRGRYCECATPDLEGADLLCGVCLLNNKDQERSRVDSMARAHDFADNGKGLRMCAVCSMWDTDPRHHGVSAVGRCSWGEERRP